jgi:hypothetical protein
MTDQTFEWADRDEVPLVDTEIQYHPEYGRLFRVYTAEWNPPYTGDDAEEYADKIADTLNRNGFKTQRD